MRALIVLLGLLIAEPAMAHAILQKATPAAGAVLVKAPKEVALRFNEALIPDFTTVEVKDNTGGNVVSAILILDRDVHATLKPLGPGTYKVKWRAVSVDTHAMQGSYSFTVK